MSRNGDYSVELARKAIEECLAYSKYGPDDIDLVMCCNITRGYDPKTMAVEPNTSLQLKEIFGFPHAVAFDVTNACGGMFTAMSIADAWLQIGAIRRALVVSGEYISGIIDTAQLEIKGFLDPRIACLTVGDAGAAVLLESATGRDVGFHELELYTVSRYNRMCIGRLTEHPHGGAIMHVPDPIKHTSISAEHSVMHAQYMFEKSPWSPDKIQHLIIHQTSRRSLRDGMRAINKAFRRKVSRDDNTIDNLSERGNTASTTHMVALWDHILSGRIKSGDRTVFAVSGSGQTIGTGLYTLDDLPDRLRNYKQSGIRPAKAAAARDRIRPPAGARVAVTSFGTALAKDGVKPDSTVLAVTAAEECLKRWGRDRNEIGLLLYTGMTHSEYISEPAIATFVAGELKINDCIESGHDRKTLAFDIYNTSMAFLNACEVACGMIQAGKYRVAMVTTSEVEMQARHFPSHPLGLAEAGSAIILEAASDARRGFGSFVYRYATNHRHARTITGRYRDGKPFFDVQIRPDLEDRYLELVQPAVDELLAREGLTLSQVRVLLPSQFSSAFNARLARALGIPFDRMVDLGAEKLDYFGNSLPFSLRYAVEKLRVQPGDVGLIVNVASGVQVGCASYYF
jgi:3-oxoacyl-[acyl-carrier-protein] synthase III